MIQTSTQQHHVRRRAGSVPHIRPGSTVVPTPTYGHVSTHRCRYLEAQIFSPGMSPSAAHGDKGPISMFGEHDQVGGKVVLHPGCPEAGRINVTVEGAFTYWPESSTTKMGESFIDHCEPRKSVFLSMTKTITVVPDSSSVDSATAAADQHHHQQIDFPPLPPTPVSAFRTTFGPRKRPSVPSLYEAADEQQSTSPVSTFRGTFGGPKKRPSVPSLYELADEQQSNSPPTPVSAFRGTFGPKKRPSVPSLRIRPSYSSQDRSFPFTFDLPRGARLGEDKPPTYSSTDFDLTDLDTFEIGYTISVFWEGTDMSVDTVSLEVPIMIHPDRDFQSLDVVPEREDSWLEMPLRCERPAPYRCAVTLPTAVTFTCPSAIPFFVVFATTPRSADLAREITADATISVSLLRLITITETPVLPATPPLTPYASSSNSSEESGHGGGGGGGGLDIASSKSSRLFKMKRAVKSSKSLRYNSSNSQQVVTVAEDKPLPRLPQQTAFTQSKILHTCFSPGFPKRPRLNFEGRKHPSLEEIASLPDGLFKSKIPLEKEMLQSIDWPGVSVKYYLDVSVLVRQEDFRARIPIRIQ